VISISGMWPWWQVRAPASSPLTVSTIVLRPSVTISASGTSITQPVAKTSPQSSHRLVSISRK